MEELIEKVRANPELYNVYHPDYMKKSLKEVVWQKISDELNYVGGDEAKTVWLKLRNCHRDALRRKECRTKTGSSIKPKIWKYENQMNFLLKYMLNKTGNENAKDAENHEEESESKPRIKIEIEEDDSLKQEGQSDNEYLYTENDSSFEIWGPSQVKRERKDSSSSDKLPETSKTHEEREKGARREDASDNDHDELYHFYMSMYGITKKLPMTRQLRLKRKIFDLVTGEQEQELTE